MDYIEKEISKQLESFQTAPYFFIGSGFSRRYLNLEDWEGLLIRFCEDLARPYEYYKTNNDGDLPSVANEMATDFNSMIWDSKEEKYVDFISRNKKLFQKKNSALKIAISEYLENFREENVVSEYSAEISELKKVNIEGVITTNWDLLLSDIFPDFTSIIGQDQLIYSNPYGIGEIFKIHGCLSLPESLVLTSDDYLDFNSRNVYLAAKLVTYFVEHPVIFIGYSISDPNIMELLTSIVRCLGETEVERLSNNFIFVKRAKEDEKITKSVKDIGGHQIPITVLELFDYGKLYRPLSQIKRRLPVRLLRYFKQQLYEFVHTNDPVEKIAVVDIDSDAEVDDIEFAIGVGILRQLGQKGYGRIKIGVLLEDILFGNHNFNSKLLVEESIPDIRGFVPIFKYVDSMEEFEMSILKKSAKSAYKRQDAKNFITENYRKQFQREWAGKELQEFFDFDDYDKVMRLLPFYKFTEEEIEVLGEYLRGKYKMYFKDGEPIDPSATTYFRKIVCMYDFLKYGVEW